MRHGVRLSRPAPAAGPCLTRRQAVWRASVEPEYYGLMMFAQTAPPGSRLLTISPTEAPQFTASFSNEYRSAAVRSAIPLFSTE